MEPFHSNLEYKVKKFPCIACLVKACCRSFDCELLTRNKADMYEFLKNDICPDCSSKEFINFQKSYIRCKNCGHLFKIDQQYKLCYRWWIANERGKE
jgi:hypothetical protein